MSKLTHALLFGYFSIIMIVGLAPHWFEFEETATHTTMYCLGGLGLAVTIYLYEGWHRVSNIFVGAAIMALSIALAWPWIEEIRAGEEHFAFGITWVGAALGIGIATSGVSEWENRRNTRRELT